MEDEERAREKYFQSRDLDDVSIEELQERIVELEAEITTLRAVIEKKHSVRSAADSIFSR
ncbi:MULTISPECIES: DUF1192 domain-containing protein [unclassified Minwuia]|uniref:DUF1192 domain-containing protein n=1 Tax=unclassified Minwuia TaxID=2618799 RepID=UPI002479791A|nr:MULTISPECIES: DUF1192 domain-containing protein [unclassified Minwuia]